MDWIRRSHRCTSRISIIWKVVIKALNPIRAGINWRIHSGNKVHIGIDPWIGYGNMHRLPNELIHHLQNHNSTHIAHIANDDNTTFLQ